MPRPHEVPEPSPRLWFIERTAASGPIAAFIHAATANEAIETFVAWVQAQPDYRPIQSYAHNVRLVDPSQPVVYVFQRPGLAP